MRAKDVMGKRIIGIQQDRFYDEENRRTVYDVTRIYLEGGSYISLFPSETGQEPVIIAKFVKAQRKAKS